MTEIIKNIKHEGAQTQATPAPAEVPKPKKKKFKVIILLILLLIMLVIGGYFLYQYLKGSNKKTETNIEERFAGELKVRDPKVDESKKVEKAMGPAGGVIQIEANGNLYTLTVPPEALLIPVNVSLAPLTETPIENYAREDLGFGVAVGPDSNFLNQTASLTVQKGEKKPTTAPEWGRCEIGSRGYDAEICAGEQEFPFNYGVEPGKISLFANKDRGIMFMPTIPTGEDGVVSSRVWRGGPFLFDKVNKTELSQLAAKGVANSSDMANEVEPMIQVLAYEGNLEPYQDKIKDLKRSKSSYPRTIMEAIFLANEIGEKDVTKEKVDEFLKEYEQNFRFIRSAYLPWASYASTYHQLEILCPDKIEKGTSFIPQALAKANKGKVQRNTEAARKANGAMLWGPFLAERKRMMDEAWATFNKTNLSACEKVDAIEMLKLTKAEMTEAQKEQARAILKEAAKCCSTSEMCAKAAAMAKWLNDPETEYEALKKKKALEDKAKKNCTPSDSLTHKKGLEDFGYNEPCEPVSDVSGSSN